MILRISATNLSLKTASGTISLPQLVGSLATMPHLQNQPAHTFVDWINDAIKDAYRVKALRARKDIRGKLYAWFDGAQGWVLVAIIGFFVACVAFFVDVTENVLFDYKDGYCTGKHLRKDRYGPY
jgi:hypothetical protein